MLFSNWLAIIVHLCTCAKLKQPPSLESENRLSHDKLTIISKHILETNQPINWGTFQILDKDSNCKSRLVFEKLHMKHNEHLQNIQTDIGLLSNICNI